MSRDNVIFFWHPIVKKKICRGIGKIAREDLARLRVELQRLRDEKPEVESEAPLGIGREAFDFYFHPIYGENWNRRYREYLSRQPNALRRMAKEYGLSEFPKNDVPPQNDERVHELEAENKRLRAQVDALAQVIADMKRPELSTGTPQIDEAVVEKLAANQEAEAMVSGVSKKYRKPK